MLIDDQDRPNLGAIKQRQQLRKLWTYTEQRDCYRAQRGLPPKWYVLSPKYAIKAWQLQGLTLGKRGAAARAIWDLWWHMTTNSSGTS